MNEELLLKRKRRNDRLASVFISLVGIGTIISVLLILLVITMEIVPLFFSSDAESVVRYQKNKPLVLGMDPWQEKGYHIDASGTLNEFDLKDGAKKSELSLVSDGQITALESGLDGSTTFVIDGKKVQREKIVFKPFYPMEGGREIRMKRTEPVTPEALAKDVRMALSRENEDGRVTFVRLDVDGDVHVTVLEKTENFMGEIEIEENNTVLKINSPVLRISANPSGSRVYTLHQNGHLAYWNTRFTKPKPESSIAVDMERRKIVDLVNTVGGEGVVVAFDNGDLEVFSLLTQKTGKRSPIKIHEVNLEMEVERVLTSPRNRTIFAISPQGKVKAWYSTSERILGEFDLGGEGAILGISPRGTGLLGFANGQVSVWDWKSPHPEAGVKALFGKVWYSGYSEPDFVWQSSSGSDDFESKMSLVPLIFGSFKGAIYAMLFSIPFAVFAALYTSVFATPKVKSIIKPTVEMMAAIPSVVIGFLAALWLAPLLDENLLTAAFAVPVAGGMLTLLPFIFGNVKGKDLMVLKPGLILFVACLMILCSLFIADHIGVFVESTWFEGNFRGWLNREINYDIRNSVIIGIALGFTVIPIIYTISEDALSSVPKGLTSASLALGATPWQTAWRVVLPAASPGIFAAVTLGLGRAVGETMIVLMATGNTAIMDMNIFEGFRALSANIAVEIPEAPQGGTLYRVLFLSAGVLLVFTSVLNTATEVIRQRLAKTYSRF
jgi:phosphate transport system permease protein